MADDNQGGARLRWWQEEEKTAIPKQNRWYSEPTIVQEQSGHQAQAQLVRQEPLDIFEELELEAQRRAELERNSVIIEGDSRLLVKRMRKRWFWTMTPAILINLAIALFAHTFVPLGTVFFLLIEVFFLDMLMRNVYKKGPPRVITSDLGLTIQLPLSVTGPIFWNEIKSVKVRRVFFQRVLEIQLNDPKAVFQRAYRAKETNDKPLRWWQRDMMSHLVKRGKITIDDSAFPVSAEEMAKQIAAFQNNSTGRKE